MEHCTGGTPCCLATPELWISGPAAHLVAGPLQSYGALSVKAPAPGGRPSSARAMRRGDSQGIPVIGSRSTTHFRTARGRPVTAPRERPHASGIPLPRAAHRAEYRSRAADPSPRAPLLSPRGSMDAVSERSRAFGRDSVDAVLEEQRAHSQRASHELHPAMMAPRDVEEEQMEALRQVAARLAERISVLQSGAGATDPDAGQVARSSPDMRSGPHVEAFRQSPPQLPGPLLSSSAASPPVGMRRLQQDREVVMLASTSLTESVNVVLASAQPSGHASVEQSHPESPASLQPQRPPSQPHSPEASGHGIPAGASIPPSVRSSGGGDSPMLGASSEGLPPRSRSTLASPAASLHLHRSQEVYGSAGSLPREQLSAEPDSPTAILAAAVQQSQQAYMTALAANSPQRQGGARREGGEVMPGYRAGEDGYVQGMVRSFEHQHTHVSQGHSSEAGHPFGGLGDPIPESDQPDMAVPGLGPDPFTVLNIYAQQQRERAMVLASNAVAGPAPGREELARGSIGFSQELGPPPATASFDAGASMESWVHRLDHALPSPIAAAPPTQQQAAEVVASGSETKESAGDEADLRAQAALEARLQRAQGPSQTSRAPAETRPRYDVASAVTPRAAEDVAGTETQQKTTAATSNTSSKTSTLTDSEDEDSIDESLDENIDEEIEAVGEVAAAEGAEDAARAMGEAPGAGLDAEENKEDRSWRLGADFRRAGMVPPIGEVPPAQGDAGRGRLSPGSLQRKMASELQLLDDVEEARLELAALEQARMLATAQQEMVGLAKVIENQQEAAERAAALQAIHQVLPRPRTRPPCGCHSLPSKASKGCRSV
ncbi:hypothetical protein CYMTET_53335 [Cymbomonas tetramitiformis]|uniref:Uncharacterized protein n=1 Tax=Cymbomonas tetramitiformis TaxID=36881 RepID=A0AAE0ERU6_9CHLO|nr:hypothetical protein CYMTET_53335 [Cymbomonas tetramitiformis]